MSTGEGTQDRLLPYRTYSTRGHNCKTTGYVCAATTHRVDIECGGPKCQAPSLDQCLGPTQWMLWESRWAWYSPFDDFRQRHHQRNSDRKKWRRSKRGRGSSKTCVSPASNSNSFPHSSTGQPTRNFSLLDPSAVGCVRTTQVPHLGQVTHEHAMRSAIGQLYCAIDERPSSTLALSLSLLAGRIFRLRMHFEWGTR